jgi:hypothetical protein
LRPPDGVVERLQPGHEPRPHDQIIYILAGQIDFHIGDTVTRRLVAAPNARRGGVLNLDVFIPKRDEYAT